MFETLPRVRAPSIQNNGSSTLRPEDFFRPELFGECARVIWKDKPDAALADLAGVSDRAARDWLSGKVAPPNIIVCVVMAALFGRR